MNAMKCACPTCKTVLQIAQSLPVRVQCPKCTTVFTVAAPPGAPPVPAPAPIRAGAPAARAPAARAPAASTAVRASAPAAEPMLMPRNRSRRAAGYKPKKRGGMGVALVVVGIIILLAAGGVLAAYFGGLFNKPTDNKPPENTQQGNNGGGVIGGGKGAGGGNGPKQLNKQEKEIQDAIDKGVKYLKDKLKADYQHTDGKKYYFLDRAADVGASALAALTLLECDVDPTDDAIQMVYRDVHERAPNLSFSYSLSLSILFLDRIYQARQDKLDDLKKKLEDLKQVPGKNLEIIQQLEKEQGPLQQSQARDREAIHRLTTRILANQHVKGGWGYYCRPLKAEREQELLVAFKRGDPFTPTVVGQGNTREDSSINQFMTLGLWTARRHNIKTDAALLRVAQRYRDIQETDGSWGYLEGDKSLKDATTCAGMIALAVGEAIKADAIPDKDRPKKPKNILEEDPNISKGTKYLSKSVGLTLKITAEKRQEREKDTVEMLRLIKEFIDAKTKEEQTAVYAELNKLDQPNRLKGTYFAADAWGDLYFLWSVERVAVVYDLKKIGGVDWFDWGSRLILKNQQKDGSWTDRFPGIPDTCFALLFLKRANVVKDLTNKLRGLDARPGVGASPVPPPTPPAPGRKE